MRYLSIVFVLQVQKECFLPWEKFTKLENLFEMDEPTVCNFRK